MSAVWQVARVWQRVVRWWRRAVACRRRLVRVQRRWWVQAVAMRWRCRWDATRQQLLRCPVVAMRSRRAQQRTRRRWRWDVRRRRACVLRVVVQLWRWHLGAVARRRQVLRRVLRRLLLVGL